MVNSHIQMPKQVLKNFTNKNGQLFIYDFEKKIISMGYPKTVYTEWGYYSDDIETFLGCEIESDLGKLLKFIKETSFETGTELPVKYREIALKYVYSLIARSPLFQCEINNNSVFFQFLSKIEQHDIAAHDGYLLTSHQMYRQSLSTPEMYTTSVILSLHRLSLARCISSTLTVRRLKKRPHISPGMLRQQRRVDMSIL